MAKRSKIRYRTKVKRIYSRARGGIGGSFKPALVGAICGAGGKLAANYLGNWGQPVVNAAAGWFFKDKTAMFLAGYTAGNMILGNGSTGTGGVR